MRRALRRGYRNSPASPCLVTLPRAGSAPAPQHPRIEPCRQAPPLVGLADRSPNRGGAFPFRIGKAPPVFPVGPAGSVGRLALALVDLLEVGVHDLFVTAALAARLAAVLAAALLARPALTAIAASLGLVELLADSHGDLRERLGLGLD